MLLALYINFIFSMVALGSTLSFLPSCKGAITYHFSVGLGRGKQEALLENLTWEGGWKNYSPKNLFDSCSPLPSPTLKWQVIAPLQRGRKEQEGTWDFEGGGGPNGEKKNIGGTLGTLFFQLWSPPKNHKFFESPKKLSFFILWKKRVFWGTQKMVSSV